MHDTLTEDDLALIHALQIRPRAAWSELAPILDTKPATLARRWDRISTSGLAWITAYPRHIVRSDTVTALVEVDCSFDRLDEVCRRLAADARIATLEHAARGRDLILTVLTPSMDDLSALLLDELPRIGGLRSTRTHVASQIYSEGSRWRLDALAPSQISALGAIDPQSGAPGGQAAGTIPESGLPIAEALARDGRATAAEIGERIGRPASTVRRQLGTLMRSGSLVFRCEVAQLRTRWPIAATWWCRVPSAERDPLVTALRAEPRVRVCMALTGPTNFLVTMWTSSLTDLMRAQERIEALLAHGEIVDTSVILRTRKRMGWILHPDGRATGEVVPLSSAR
ncbi:Lrp/AsnC family transcriptional regulator [Rhodococcus olei]|uniref:Lrp/AsnC family transcriptional regulator n=1 Tax=Rhodococcus olei TaxID=2161675 RepID=A0ABP8NZ49_9NOCA